jgi:lysophospholipase L1-like esterase
VASFYFAVRMRILFIGDSIIKGTTGVNWVKHLARKHPEWEVENEGINGDTLMKIRERLEKKLQITTSYDVIVIGGGANDILIPSLEKRNFLFRKAYAHLVKKGYQPLTNPEDTGTVFHEMIHLIKQYSRAVIIVTTIGCLSEDPGFHLNRKKDIMNTVIRKVARDNSCTLADIAVLFDRYLDKRKTKTYFLQSFFNTTYLDALQCRLLNRADALSRQRGLWLTIDGLHLNSRGGVIWLNEIEKQLLSCQYPNWLTACRPK